MLARVCQFVTAAVIVVAIGCTWWRLYEEQPRTFEVNDEIASSIARCLPDSTIPAGVSLSVRTRPQAALHVETVGTLAIALPDPPVSAPARIPLKGRALIVKKSDGDFEIRSNGEPLVLHKADGAELLAVEPAVFVPTPQGTYHVKTDDESSATLNGTDAEARPAVAPNSTLGTLSDSAFDGVLTQPLAARPLIAASAPFATLERTTAAHSLLRVTGHSDALSSATASLHDGDVLAACVNTSLDHRTWLSATAIAGATPGTFSVDIPGNLKANLWNSDYVWVSVATRDGKSALLGGLNLVSQPAAAVVSVALTLLLLGFVMWRKGLRRQHLGLEARWLSGLFVGPDNDPSLSLLQMFIWTVVTVWGMFYVFLVVGSLLTVTATMMALLGIAGSSSVLARFIAAANGGSTSSGSTAAPPTTTPIQATVPSAGSSEFWKMLSTNGRFDLLKLQMFAFTVVVAIYVVSRILQVAAFPDLDANTLLLMGVSQGVYISSKLAAITPLAKAQGVKSDLDATQGEVERLTTSVTDATTARDEKVAAAANVNPTDPAAKAAKDAVDQANVALATQQALLEQAKARVVQLTSDYDKTLEPLGLKRN